MDGKPYPQDVQENLKYRPPAGKKLFLSISPLDKDRRGLAPYWGETDNQPLPPPWNREPLNSARVKRAYLNFVLRAVETMRPDFLAIGVEANVLLSRDLLKWEQFKDLYRETYRAVKKVHKALPVFFTTDVLHYKRLAREARSTQQEKEVAELMRFSDLFAMSVYPHMSADVPRPVPANFLDFATRFKRPVAVAESGMSAQDIELRSYATPAARLRGRPVSIHRAHAQNRRAGLLRFRHQLRQHRLRAFGRPAPAAPRRSGAHLGVYRHADQRQAAQVCVGGVGWVLARQV